MVVNVLAFPPLFISAICIYAGLYHFFIYLKRRQLKENLHFANCCFSVALYTYFCFRLYTAGNYESGVYWQRWQIAILLLLSISLLRFLGCFVQIKSFGLIKAMSVCAFSLFLLELFLKNDLTLVYGKPLVKTVHLGRYVITYFEASMGIINQIGLVFFLFCIAYLIFIFFKYRKNYNVKYSKFLFGAIVFFIAGIFNDASVSMGVYRFIYLAEYTYMIIILTMAFILASRYNDLYAHIENMNKSLEQKIRERTKELIEKAHKAGMADIAVETLHNVGNLLNSINSSIEAIRVAVKDSPFQGLFNANKLLSDNMGRLDEFISVDPRGRKLMQYFLKLEEPLRTTLAVIEKNIRRLNEKVGSMSGVITAQQSYAGVGGLTENVTLSDLIEDSLIMESASLERHNISIVKDYARVPAVLIQKAKLVHILVNVIRNAISAMQEVYSGNKRIAISIKQEEAGGPVFIRVKDNGRGIEKENLKKIFSFGFTTKKDGHGFGLHSSVNYMKEMGGEMWAESEGEKKGTTFILKFNGKPERR